MRAIFLPSEFVRGPVSSEEFSDRTPLTLNQFRAVGANLRSVELLKTGTSHYGKIVFCQSVNDKPPVLVVTYRIRKKVAEVLSNDKSTG
ncbi:hypothetical protein KOR42_13620 [Thalassoglobus neptunius]|uniref:Uncharacterized protein n=1 Tax=Thalassoglobus neptunius TaxID=1938619 RepID=A0A5C5X4T7_9PLAN|nr:hypothetical protein KOR42_13620 [Thalassoglobus neptunius]